MVSKNHRFTATYAAMLMTMSMLVSSTAEACTRFVYLGINDEVITARSMDWKLDVGTNLWVFPRGMKRSGEATGGSRGIGAAIVKRLADEGADIALTYVSKPELARDLGTRGITINNVQPGPVDTDMNPADSAFGEMLRTQVMALPRYGTADEVAAMAAYLPDPKRVLSPARA